MGRCVGGAMEWLTVAVGSYAGGIQKGFKRTVESSN